MLGHERPGGGHYSAKRGFIIRSYSSKNREQEEGHTVTVTVGVRGPNAVSEVDDELNGRRVLLPHSPFDGEYFYPTLLLAMWPATAGG